MLVNLIYKDQSIVLIKCNSTRTIMSISAERERERRGGGTMGCLLHNPQSFILIMFSYSLA